MREAGRVNARLLAGRFHPLISEAVLAPLNEGARRLRWPLHYGRIPIQPYLLPR